MSKIAKFRRVALALLIAVALFALGGVLVLTGCGSDNDDADTGLTDTTDDGGDTGSTPSEEVTCTHSHTTTTTTATCTAAGVRTVTCDDCNVVISSVEVPALGHAYELDNSNSVAATCTSEGKNVYICSRCGDKQETTTQKTAHSYSTVVTDPTCTEQGYTTYTCTGCGYEYVSDYVAASHHYETDITDPTCTEQGYTTYTCSLCNDTYVSDYVSATGHVWDNSAACADKECTVCQATESASASHSYTLTEDTATCTADGEKTYTCSVCSSHYTEQSLATGHTYTTDSSGKVIWTDTGDHTLKDSSTCTYECEHTAYCTTCCQDITETYESVIHSYALSVETVTDKTNCVTTCTKQMVCSGCGAVQEGTKTETSYTEHSYGEGVTVDGCTTYTCSVCSNKKTKYSETYATLTTTALESDVQLSTGTVISMSSEAVSSLGDYSSSNLTLSANKADTSLLNLSAEDLERVGDNTVYSITLSDGNDLITNFGGTVTVKLPYTLAEGEDQNNITIFYINDNGDIETIEAVYADGYVTFETTHFSYYSVGKYSDEDLCKIYGHNIKELDKTATCTESGYHIEICTRCGETITNETTAALGHNFTESNRTEATCTENGSVTYTCDHDGCNASYTGVLAATGHTWVKDETTSVAATCTHAGHNDYCCSSCGSTYSADLLQLSHNYVAVVTEPTCTTQGYTTYTCTMCGGSYTFDYVAATGHNWNSDAPCADKECLICGATLAASAEHNYENGICTVCGSGCDHSYITVVVPPTCTEYGYTQKTCDICGSVVISDYVNATGHTYTSDINKCDVCGAANPDIVNIFNSILENCYSSEFTLTLTDVSFVINQDDTYYDEHSVISYAVEGATIYIKIEDNKIIIYGSGNATAVQNEDGVKYEYTATANIYGDGEYAYVYAKMDGDEKEEFLVRISYDYILGDYGDMLFNSEETLSQLSAMIEEYLGTDLYQNWTTILNNNSDLANEIAADIFAKLFNGSKTESGYEFTLDIDLVGELNEDLYTLTVSEILDKYVGEGAFDAVKTYLNSIENKKLYDVITDILVYGEDYGITKDIAFTTINTLVTLYTESEFDIESLLTSTDPEVQAYGEMTISEILKQGTGMEDYSQLISMLDEIGGMNVYLQLTQDSESAEYLYNLVASVATSDVISIKFITDENYAVTSIQTVLADAIINTSSYTYTDTYVSGDGTEGGGETYQYTMSVAIDGEIGVVYTGSLPEEYDAYQSEINEIYAVVVNAIKAACEKTTGNTFPVDENHTFGINKDGTVYLVYEYDEFEGNWEEFEEALEEAAMAELQARYESGECNEDEARMYSSLFYQIRDELYEEVFNSYCTTYSRTATDISKADLIQITFDCTNCYEIRFYFTTEDYNLSSYFYIDVANKVISNDEFHDYEETAAPEGVPTSEDEVSCGERYYTYYECTICGDVYYVTHYKYHVTGEATYTLINEGGSCEDGVLVQYYCETCGKVVNSWTTYGHTMYYEIAFTLTCNSETGSGTSIIYHETCPCGEHSYYYFEDNGGCSFNESSGVEYVYAEDGETVIGETLTYKCYYTGCQNYYTWTYYYCSSNGDDVCTYYQYDGGDYTQYSYTVSAYRHNVEYNHSSYTDSDGYTVNVDGYYCTECGYGYSWIYKRDSNGYEVYYGYELTDSNGNLTYSWYNLYTRDSEGELISTDYYENGEYQYTRVFETTYDEATLTRTYTYEYRYSNGNTSTQTETIRYDEYGRTIYYYYLRTENGELSYWYSETYTFTDEDSCYASRTYENSDGYSEQYYEYYHMYSWIDEDNGTCTQPYKYGEYCVICGEAETTINGHEWYMTDDGTYVCLRCGLESANGSSSNIYLEDLTENEDYTPEGCFSIGYYYDGYNSSDVLVSYYFVPVNSEDNLELESDDYIEIKNITVTDTGSILYIALTDLEALAESNGISLENYDLRVSFYYIYGSDVTSITITDLAGSDSDADQGTDQDTDQGTEQDTDQDTDEGYTTDVAGKTYLFSGFVCVSEYTVVSE